RDRNVTGVQTCALPICTEEMEAMASNGIAAHWLYKSDEGESAARSNSRAQAWMGRLLEMQQKAGDSMEFIENVKVDLFPDEIYRSEERRVGKDYKFRDQ